MTDRPINLVVPAILISMLEQMNNSKNDLNTRSNYRDSLRVISDHLHSNIVKFDKANGIKERKKVGVR